MRILKVTIAVIIFSLSPSLLCQTTCDVSDVERQALVDLFNATDGQNWINPWNLSDPVCNWSGVTVINSKVVSLNLIDRNLNGYIPESISDLTSLEYLYFENNHLQNPIPISLGTMTQLRDLYLGNNEFTGSIPSQIFNLTALLNLSLAVNNFTGNIPIEITQLNRIRELYLSQNSFSGSLPESIGSLTTLTKLYLGGNNFTGNFPISYTNLFRLTELGIYNTQLSGTIPVEIRNLSSLNKLYLHWNNFSGSIPEEIGQLSSLTELYLHVNDFTGEIPPLLFSLTNLNYLWLSDNSLVGNIPTEIGSLVNLKGIGLYNNGLSGKIPASINSLSQLEELYIYSNDFIFSDFESEHNSYKSKIASYEYAPQGLVGTLDTLVVSIGDTLQIGSELFSANNTYQWYHDGVALTPISGINTLIIENVDYQDAGIYYFTATNSIIDSLTLERRPVLVEVVGGPLTQDCSDCDSFKPIPGKEYILSGWVKEQTLQQVFSYEGASIRLNFKDGNDVLISSTDFFPSGQIIETWQRISNEFTVPLNTYAIEVVLVNNSNVDCYFDDIRIHPFNGSMKSFVYDPLNQRLMAELDENNYSTYYEYDLEGGLIRTKKETERGVYTIQEARSKKSRQQ